MKQGYTHISAIIDRSGSMSSIKTDTEGGFNTFVADQKALPGTATLSLTIFDDVIQLVHDMVDIQDVPHFHLHPRNMTAMLDAIGVTITNLGEKLAKMDESERPEKVLVVIVTDGQENSSKEYSFARIKEMIKEQHDTYQWEFIFLGANQDAVLAGEQIGISRGKSMSYATTKAGVGSTYGSMSKMSASFRSMSADAKLEDFTLEDRAMAMGENVDPNVMNLNVPLVPDNSVLILSQLDADGKIPTK